MILDTSVLDRLGLAAWLALSIRATLVLAIGAVTAWLLRRRSAAARHFVWLLTLNAVLGVTAFATLTRGVAVTVPRWPQWATEGRHVPSVASRGSVGEAPAPPPVAHEDVSRGAAAHESAHEASVPAAGPVAKDPVTTEPPATKSFASEPPATEPPATRALPTRPAAVVSPGSWLILLWLAGALFVMGRLVLGHAGLAWIARRSRAVEDPAWSTLLLSLAHEAGVAQVPRLCSSVDVGSPLVCGLLRPMILLPVDAGSWDAERRRVVLLHELAHIARRDPLSQSIAWLACAIYWFQPAAWLAFARLRAEGERACDDRVLSSGVAGPDYASHLLGVARRARALRLVGAVSLAMARRSTLEGRLLALLDDGVRRGSLGVRARGAGITALAVVLIALGLVRPVPPAAAVAPTVSPEPGPAAVPAAHPSPARAANRAEAILAEPLDWIATIPSVAPAVDPFATLAPGKTSAFDRVETPAVIPSAAPATEPADAGAAVAQSVVERFDVAGSKADAPVESFRADPPAKRGDTPAHDSNRTAAPTWSTSLSPALLASAPAPGHASAAGTVTWKNPAGGLWSNPANWTPANVPDSPGESAVLPALSGAYQVTLDVNPAVDAISIDASDVTLDVNGFSVTRANLVTNSGTIRNFAGEYSSSKIRNLASGIISVAPGGTIQVAAGELWTAGTIVAAKEILWGGAVMLRGGGTLVLNGTRLFDPTKDPNLNLLETNRMMIDQGTTVRGSGLIEKDLIDNRGTLESDGAIGRSLQIDGVVQNYGTIRVLHAADIRVNRPLLMNGWGLVTSGAGGGTVRLEMPGKVFGALSAVSGGCTSPRPTAGLIRADGGDLHIGVWQLLDARLQVGPGGGAVVLDQSTTMQNIIVEAGANVVAHWLYPRGDWTNNGTVRLSKILDASGSSKDRFSIFGTGQLILEGATIGDGLGGTFVNGAGHTIRGCGAINPPFINEGTVSLDCSGGNSARIGGQPVPANWRPDGTVPMPSGSIENRGRISIARGALSITGPGTPRYPIEVAVPTVVSNQGTISADGGWITLERAVTLDNTGGGKLSAGGGIVSLGGMTGATVIGGRLDAAGGSKPGKAENLRGAPGFDNDFRVDKAATLRDVTLGPAATLITAAGGVTTAAGARVVNEGTNRIAGTFVVSPGTAYFQTTGQTLVDGGELVGAIMRGPVRGGAGVGTSDATIASGPATLRFYARNEARDASFVLELPQAADVEGRVYDAAGREVARIAQGAREAGVYRFALGRSGGAGLSNGIYFGRMVVTNAGVREVLKAKVAVIN